MNVGIFHEHAGERRSGGIAVFAREMAMALADRHTVFLYTQADTVAPELTRSDVEVVQVPTPNRQADLESLLGVVPGVSAQNAAKIGMYVACRRGGIFDHVEEHVDVLWLHQFLDDLLVSNAVAVPTVFQFHGFGGSGPGIRAKQWFADTDYHLANSPDTADRVESALGLSIDEIVYPSVDVSRFNPDVPPAFEYDEPVVLFVGRLTPRKGLAELVDAFAPLADEARLHVVGRGDDQPIRERVSRRGIGDAVTFEGIVPDEDLPGYYTASDVFCLPSRYESFGMVNLEAMASGTPVVTADTGGITDYATHGETALLADPESVEDLRTQLESLLASPAKRAKLGRAGRAVAESYAWEVQAERFARFCDRILGADGTTATSTTPDRPSAADSTAEPSH